MSMAEYKVDEHAIILDDAATIKDLRSDFADLLDAIHSESAAMAQLSENRLADEIGNLAQHIAQAYGLLSRDIAHEHDASPEWSSTDIPRLLEKKKKTI